MDKQASELGTLIEAQMRAIPVPNRAARVVQVEEGGVRLSVPMCDRAWARLVRHVLPLSKEKNIELDRLGAEIYALCDGHRTVEEIVEIHRQNWKLSFFESRAMILQFLRMLAQKNLIVFLTPAEEQR